MNIKWMISIFVIFGTATISYGDQIVLKNGQAIEANIIDETDKKVKVDVVLQNQLVGGQIEFNKREVAEINRDGRYVNLERKQLSEDERNRNIDEYRSRNKVPNDLDQKILARVERIKKRNDDIEKKQEAKRIFNEVLTHGKEVINQKHENRKDLITHANKVGIKSNVSVVDIPLGE